LDWASFRESWEELWVTEVRWAGLESDGPGNRHRLFSSTRLLLHTRCIFYNITVLLNTHVYVII